MRFKTFFFLCVGTLLLPLVLELIARYGLGLGNPPLSIGDTEIDYLFAPNQICNRFGNRVVYNNFSMRSEHDIDGAPDPGKCRILLVGDSVINGGVLTDQSDLASSLLDTELRAKGLGDAFNVSAGSWGPMNYAAYFKKYGIFGATDLVLELTAHDLWEDDPRISGGKGVGVDVSFPQSRPLSAAWEGFVRYFMPRVRDSLGIASVNAKVDVPHNLGETRSLLAKQNLDACAYLYSLPFKRKYLVIHRTQIEWAQNDVPAGEFAFRKLAEESGVDVLLLSLDVQTDYRDHIHLNASGQYKLYQLLSDAILGEDADDGK